MRVRTDDEVYRVDAVWLGPPKATFPWRARYVAWGVGIVTFFVVLGVERQLGIGFGFFTVAWGLIITIVLTRLICGRITHERPLGTVLTMWVRELTTPREKTASRGGAASASRITVKQHRPRPRHHRRQQALPGVERPQGGWGNPRPGVQVPPRHRGMPEREEVGSVRTPART
ncbi:MAG: hypothetical protein ACRDRN_10045 [Sciscionella sp.]